MRLECLTLGGNLRKNSKGGDVISLQNFLAAFPELYPDGLVTGHFGPKTEMAVKKLQAAHGLEQTGEVGPKTRTIIRDLSCVATGTKNGG